MKNLVISFLTALLLFSCSKLERTCTDRGTCCGRFSKNFVKSDVGEVLLTGGVTLPIPIHVSLLDETHQDLLNPASPAFLGNNFFGGIKTYGFWDGKRQHCVAMNPIDAPNRSNQSPFYYVVNLYWFKPVIEDDRHVFYTYICYPDGSEDEIKVRENSSDPCNVFYDKIWVNGELVYDQFYDVSKENLWRRYYNPNYFHWMEPVYDMDGNHVGNIPTTCHDFVYITKQFASVNDL